MSHTLRYLRLSAPKQLTTTTAFIFVMLFFFFTHRSAGDSRAQLDSVF